MVVSQGEKQIWGRKEVGVVIEGHMKDPNGVGTVPYLHRGDGYTHTHTDTHTHTSTSNIWILMVLGLFNIFTEVMDTHTHTHTHTSTSNI